MCLRLDSPRAGPEIALKCLCVNPRKNHYKSGSNKANMDCPMSRLQQRATGVLWGQYRTQSYPTSEGDGVYIRQFLSVTSESCWFVLLRWLSQFHSQRKSCGEPRTTNWRLAAIGSTWMKMMSAKGAWAEHPAASASLLKPQLNPLLLPAWTNTVVI